MAVKINKGKTSAKASEKKDDAKTASKPAPATDASAKSPAGTQYKDGKKAKTPSAKKEERSHAFTERIDFAAALILSQKMTDEDIIVKVNEKFPNYNGLFNQKEVGRTRWMLRHDMTKDVHADGGCFDRVYSIDGKLVPKADKPKTAHAKRKAKYNAESDPLNIIAGVNVHDDKKPIKKAKSKVAPAQDESASANDKTI